MSFRIHYIPIALITCLLATAHEAANAAPQATLTPVIYQAAFSTASIGAVTPTPLQVSLYDSTFGSNYWPYVATDANGDNTLIPSSSISFFAQTTNAGNQPTSASHSATSARSSSPTSQTSTAASTTMLIQTGNMAADRYGSTVGLTRPAAVVIGAAVIIGGAML